MSVEQLPGAAAFIGYWRITAMEVWAQDYVDLVVPGFIEFTHEDDHLMGTFQFGTVSGWLDCRLRDNDGVTFIEWSWEGQNDTDPGCGRGWQRWRTVNSLGASSSIAATIRDSRRRDNVVLPSVRSGRRSVDRS